MKELRGKRKLEGGRTAIGSKKKAYHRGHREEEDSSGAEAQFSRMVDVGAKAPTA